MTDHDDIATMLTEVGLEADETDPFHSVGPEVMIRSERTAAQIPAYRPHGDVGERHVTVGELIVAGERSALHHGTQHSMRRPVAVRAVNPRTADPTAVAGRILSEAWMLGSLEHANILPVYSAGRDEDGSPLVVMRFANTVPWSHVLSTPNHPLGCPRGVDPIEFEIRRMLYVCRALEHAHSRGIVHRDVKPENVMIDEDGSVYLHGWMLGVTLEPDPTGRWPLARDQTKVAGTPAYMAPELARRDVEQLSPRTDVYLVGATLHHVLTGQPRHLGENVFDAFYSAIQSEPVDYAGRLPSELAAILNRATARDPAARFATVTELREALEQALRHLGSHRLTQHGRKAAEDFRAALAHEADDVVVRDLFWVAHGYFRAALEEWPGNDDAQRGASRIASEMTRYDVQHDTATPVSDVLDRISGEAPRKRPMRSNAPVGATEPVPTSGSSDRRRRRVTFLVAAAVIWTIYPFVMGVADFWGAIPATLTNLQVGAMVAWLALTVVMGLLGPAFLKDLRNRAVTVPMAVVLFSSLGLQIYSTRMGASPLAVINQHHLLFFIVTAMLTAAVSTRMWVTPVVYFVAFVLGMVLPTSTLFLLALSNAVGLGWSAWFAHANHSLLEERLR